MKNKIFNVLFGDQKVFDIKSLAFFEGKFASSRTMLAYSLIIAYHPGVLGEIVRIRKLLNLQNLYQYPNNSSLEVLAGFSHEHINNNEGRDLLEAEIKKLIDKLKLPEVWDIPLTIMVLTGVLPVPYEHNSLEFSYPKRLLKTHEERFEPEKQPSSLRDLYPMLLARDFVSQQERAKYPCIVIREYVRPNSINKYIKANWKWIEPVLLNLPKRQHKSVDIDLDRFSLGVWLFIQKRLLGNNWGEIDSKISEFEKNDPDFFGGEDGAPSKTDCQKLYEEIENDFALIYPL